MTRAGGVEKETTLHSFMRSGGLALLLLTAAPTPTAAGVGPNTMPNSGEPRLLRLETSAKGPFPHHQSCV